jgi:hypothetical protein
VNPIPTDSSWIGFVPSAVDRSRRNWGFFACFPRSLLPWMDSFDEGEEEDQDAREESDRRRHTQPSNCWSGSLVVGNSRPGPAIPSWALIPSSKAALCGSTDCWTGPPGRPFIRSPGCHSRISMPICLSFLC